MLETTSSYMLIALDEAAHAAARDEVPVGAVIVDPSERTVIAAEGNRIRERQDPTAHAEMMAIQAACRAIGSERLVGLDIYVTLEPCPMCAQAISLARIRRLYYGAADKKGGGVEQGPSIYSQPTCHHAPEVYGGINELRASLLLRDFFEHRR